MTIKQLQKRESELEKEIQLSRIDKQQHLINELIEINIKLEALSNQ